MRCEEIMRSESRIFSTCSTFLTVRDFLRDELSAGPMSAKDIMSRAQDAGFSQKTIKRAKSALGVESDKIGTDCWVWRRPGIDVPESPEVASRQPFPEVEEQKGRVLKGRRV